MKKERRKNDNANKKNPFPLIAPSGATDYFASRPFVIREARCKNCPAFEFCGKRVLMVGGIDRMEGRYRELVETCGGTFEHHKGTMKKGVKKLKSSLRRADVVLCPVCNNSHTACQQVKKLGKKFNKPVYLLSNYSLNTISQAIHSQTE
ncbi:MAG: DUF2325 domain-containing protein [Deltaproteobacteria bacterium]|nr:DUF2325 domain-containing protein [Deltaproteobacteria bacterium]